MSRQSRVLTWIKLASLLLLIFLSAEARANVTWSSGSQPPADYTSSGIVTVTGTVTLQPGTYTFATLTVNSPGKLILQGDTGVNGGVIINATTLTVSTGGTISADGQGYGSALGSGAGGSSTSGGGGSFGGAGGNSTNGTSGGPIYGGATNPTSLGSGGGAGSAAGGAGGGAAQIVVSGTLTVTGTGVISANGAAPGSGSGGGGSGGSIWISAGVFTGTGKVNANGGGATGGGGSGGGGRVYISYTTNSFTGTTTANAGTVSGGGVVGSAGTSLFVNSATNDVTCMSAGVFTLSATDFPTPLGGLTVQGQCKLTIPGLASLSFITVTASGSTLTVNGDLSTSITGNVTLTTSAIMYLNGNTLTGAGNTITAANISVDSTSKILADGLGYGAGLGPGAGVGSGGSGSGGAGYGGAGGTGASASGGVIYGTLINPTSLGSGGGSGTGVGGSGGGAMKLVASSTLTLNGALSAIGTNGTTGSGGGSGGSIWINAGTFTGSGSASVNGGKGTTAGGGGGGRIYASYSTANSYSGTMTAAGGTGSVAGSGGSILFFNSTSNDIYINYSMSLAAGTYSFGSNITVVSPAQLTFASDLVGGVGGALSAPNITINSGASIIADGQGYGSMSGPGAGSSGSTNGGGGGGYGGVGGNAAMSLSAPQGGPIYGSPINPAYLGSGGGTSFFGGGATGGGAIKLVVSGTLTVNGTLSSNGAAPANYGGGGSGGSIWVDVGTIGGTGKITVNGGSATANSDGSGGGGGGRIYISYSSSNSYSGTMTASGGPPASGGTAGAGGSVLLANSLTNQLFINSSMTFGAGYYLLGDVTISNNATVTLAGDPVRGIGVTIDANNITINSGSSLVADGQGNGVASGPGAGVTNIFAGGGGGYGGAGGKGNSGGAGGPAYGSSINPSDLGSGGGNGNGTLGGAGGGAIKLVVSGTLTVSGTLSANGANGANYAGGGSGGSVWVNVGTITGAGKITANGGNGPSGGGGGGGGRIAISYTTNTFSGTTSSTGGTGNIAGGAGTSPGLISNGTAVKLGFTLQPSNLVQAGVNFSQQPIVSILDSNGNTVPSANDVVILTAFTDASCTTAAPGTLTGSSSTTNGMAWASGVSYSNPSTIYLKASSGSLTSACSTAIMVGGHPATQLVFTTQPSLTGDLSVNLVQQPVVTAQDNDGYTDYFFKGAVTLSAYSDSACTIPVGVGTLNGSATTATGVAAFSGVNFNKALTIYLKATSGSLSGCSSSVTIASGPAAKLAFTTEPSMNATAGVNFPQQPVVTIQDTYGNTVTASSAAVTLTAYTNASCTFGLAPGVLSGSATTVNGVASFSGENYTIASTIYLKATSGTLTSDCSSKVIVTAGPATQLIYTTQPSPTGAVSSNLKTQPVVTAQDAYGNTDLTYSSAVSLGAYMDSSCTTPAVGTVSGSATTSGGVASFSGVGYNQVATIYIKSSSGGLTSACSSAVSLVNSVLFFFRGY